MDLKGFVVKESEPQEPVETDMHKGIIGSGFSKHERSGSIENESRSSKMVKSDEFLAPKTMPYQQGTVPFLRSNSQGQMLSFSSLKSDVSLPPSKHGSASSYYRHSDALYSRNAGYRSGSSNGNMHGAFVGVRGPFTPSQWIELEHQALIYKYLNANVPVPSNLLIPIKKAFYPFALSAGSLPPHSLAWNSFHHLGFSSSTDPEPGRCRRTDGKKWRCSRDAVIDQKYCERHINRGRHRSRKPVEGQNGHALSGTTTSKVAPRASSIPITSVISSVSASNNSLGIAPNQYKSLVSNATNPSIGGSSVNRTQVQPCRSILSPTMNLNSSDNLFSSLKQSESFEEPSQSDFGFVSSDSLLNPMKKTSYINSKKYVSFEDFNDQVSQDQNQFRQFTEHWPKEQSDRTGISWSDDLTSSDWTQLSMSTVPMNSGFSSSSSSPAHEKLIHSPLKLSHEFDPYQVGFEKNGYVSERSGMQIGWMPAVPWGSSSSSSSSMGGPLGEVLNNTNCTLDEAYKNSPSINIMNVGWNGSSQMESSPTGVLQKVNFASLSNSSTSGSSSRGESMKSHERGSLCNDVLGSAMASYSSIPLH